MDFMIVRNIVAIVTQWRGKERHEPYRVDAQFLKVIEFLFKPLKITDPIPVAVLESAHVHLINDRVLVPQCIVIEWQTPSSWGNFTSRQRRLHSSLYEVTTAPAPSFRQTS